jgi:hypothetical protein
MHPAAQAYRDALEREHAAALRADFEALLVVQDEKRALVPSMREATLSDEEVETLAVQARANIALMRHLVQCLQGAAGVNNAGATYSARGEARLEGGSNVRGVL